MIEQGPDFPYMSLNCSLLNMKSKLCSQTVFHFGQSKYHHHHHLVSVAGLDWLLKLFCLAVLTLVRDNSIDSFAFALTVRNYISQSVTVYVNNIHQGENTEVICFHSVEPPYFLSSKTQYCYCCSANGVSACFFVRQLVLLEADF